jgi:molybdopterin-containing oxidoreductase family membrane subunit
MTVTKSRQSRSLFTPLNNWYGLLGVLIAIGIYGVIQVLLKGLQVTGLSDQVPWGLWITIDLSAIALGAGAFTFSAVVYVFRIKQFEPLARPAVFIGFLGYTSAMISLAMDIGRPDRFWHPIVYWNVHSVLWEITWCVILYSSVLAMEFLPVLLEGKFFDRWPKLRTISQYLHRATPVFAILGLALSLLHQSSLGATYGVLSGRAIWYKPSMPIMFIISAAAGGMALTLFAAIFTGILRNRELIGAELKRATARIVGYALLIYLYLKLWDWATTYYYSHAPGTADAVNRLNAATPYTSTFWWIEILLAGLVPAILLLYPRTNRSDRNILFATSLVVLGVIINRWNTTLSGLVAPPQWSPGVLGNLSVVSYSPTLIEIAVGLGIIGYALMAFTIGVRHLPIFSKHEIA